MHHLARRIGKSGRSLRDDAGYMVRPHGTATLHADLRLQRRAAGATAGDVHVHILDGDTGHALRGVHGQAHGLFRLLDVHHHAAADATGRLHSETGNAHRGHGGT